MFFRFVTALLIVFSCTSCQMSRKSSSQSLRMNITQDPFSMDPRKARELNDCNLAQVFNEGLTKISDTNQVELAAASLIEKSEDNLVYTIHLKPSKWSNKLPVKASDFVYSWKKSLSPEFRCDLVAQLYCIKNARAVKEGLLPSSMLGVKVLDDATFQVTLEKPTPYFLKLLSLPTFFAVCETVDRENPNWASKASTYVGNGPFLMKEWLHNDKIIAVKNTSYWDQAAVKLQEIEMVMVPSETAMNMYENNELDLEGSPFSTLLLDSLESLKKQKTIKVTNAMNPFWLRVNTSRPYLNKSVRQALLFGICRKEIIDHVLTGSKTILLSAIPDTMHKKPTSFFKDGDVAHAKQLLHQAKEPLPALRLIYSNTMELNGRVAQALQDQLKKEFSIELVLEPLEGKICMNQLLMGDYDLALGNWVADFNDPINILEIFREKKNAANATGWENVLFQKELDATYHTEGSEREEHLLQAEKILLEDAPIIPLFNNVFLSIHDKTLKNFILTGDGRIDLKHVYLEK